MYKKDSCNRAHAETEEGLVLEYIQTHPVNNFRYLTNSFSHNCYESAVKIEPSLMISEVKNACLDDYIAPVLYILHNNG